jgi:hypothetical protein
MEGRQNETKQMSEKEKYRLRNYRKEEKYERLRFKTRIKCKILLNTLFPTSNVTAQRSAL